MEPQMPQSVIHPAISKLLLCILHTPLEYKKRHGRVAGVEEVSRVLDTRKVDTYS
jgi:hypothetical protein